MLTVISEIGSNIINTTIRKITNWVHLASITLVHYELVIITTMQKIIYHYFGHTRKNNLIFILISALIIFLAGTNFTIFLKYQHFITLMNNFITCVL